MPNSTTSSVAPAIFDGMYNTLEVLRERNDTAMDLLATLLRDHRELRRKVVLLENNDSIQDGRITALEADVRMVRAELVRSRPRVPVRSTTVLPQPLSPGKNVRLVGKDRVLCPKCAKDLAKRSLKKHMNSNACKRHVPVHTQ